MRYVKGLSLEALRARTEVSGILNTTARLKHGEGASLASFLIIKLMESGPCSDVSIQSVFSPIVDSPPRLRCRGFSGPGSRFQFGPMMAGPFLAL